MYPPSQIEICEGVERSPVFDPLVKQRLELFHDRSCHLFHPKLQGRLRWNELEE